jgi:hypothetical protein
VEEISPNGAIALRRREIMDENALLLAFALMYAQKARRQSPEDWERDYLRLEELNEVYRSRQRLLRVLGWLRSPFVRSRIEETERTTRDLAGGRLPDLGSP